MVFTSPLSMCSDILEVSISWYPPFEANSCSATSTPTTATTIQNHGPRMKRFTVVTSGAQPPTSSDSTSGVRTPQRRTQTVHGRGEQSSESRITTGHAQVTLKIPARIRAGSRVDGRSECAHAAQVAVALVVVQAVAHHEGVGDVEADVLHVDRHLERLGLAEQGEDLDGGGPP